MLSQSSNATSVTILWNFESTSTVLGTNNIVILCIGVAMFILFFWLCFGLFKFIKKSRSGRVASETAYQYIPAESSVSGYLQVHLPMKMYIVDDEEKSCCICFDV